MSLFLSRTEDAEEDSNIKHEVIAIEQQVLNATKLVTHVRADLDALISLVLAQIFRDIKGLEHLPVFFEPGGRMDFERGVLALDIGIARGLRSTQEGGFMIKSSSVGGSCCMAMLRLLPKTEQDILKTLVEEISLTDEDQEGRNTVSRVVDINTDWRNNQIKNALLCTSIFDVFQSLRDQCQDHELYEIVLKWIYGTLNRGMRRKEIRESNPWLGVNMAFGGRLAILPIGASIYQAKYLEKHGVEFTIHGRGIIGKNNKWSLGLHKAQTSAADLIELFGEKVIDLPGIYIGTRFIGWTVKGGSLSCSEQQFRIMRDRLIAIAKEVLCGWFSALKH